MESGDGRGAGRTTARRLCQTLLSPGQARPGGGHPQGARAGGDHDRNGEQEGKQVASGDQAALGRPIQLLSERCRLGADVAAGVSHKWLAQRLEEAKIGFELTKNALTATTDHSSSRRSDTQ